MRKTTILRICRFWSLWRYFSKNRDVTAKFWQRIRIQQTRIRRKWLYSYSCCKMVLDGVTKEFSPPLSQGVLLPLTSFFYNFMLFYFLDQLFEFLCFNNIFSYLVTKKLHFRQFHYNLIIFYFMDPPFWIFMCWSHFLFSNPPNI